MNKYNEFIGVKDSMDAPRKLMEILYNKEDRERLFRDIQNTSPDWSVDLFREYFEDELARLKFKEQILKEILFDLAVCEIEGWDKKEYINQLQELLNGIKI